MDRRWSRGALAVASLGAALAAGFTWNFLEELRALAVTWPPVAVFLLGIGLSGGLVAAGRWLARSELGPDLTLTVAAWSYGGAAVLVLIGGSTIAVRLAEGRAVEEPQLDLLVSAASGGLAGAAVGHRTVLARREAERAAREAEDAARARDTMGFLNRTLRHEVLNGLQLIGGHASALDGAVDDAGEESLRVIEDTIRELAELIQDVRGVADVQAGDADVERVDLAALLAEEAERIVRAHPEATVETDLPETASAAATGAVEHVFRNLLENAVEHNDDDPTVAVAAERTPDAVRVEVADDGPGIPDEQKDRLFEPERGDTHGFGLHLVQALVTGYGGTVGVEDGDSGGAVFVVELPRAELPAVADGASADGSEDEEASRTDGGTETTAGTNA